MRKISKLKTPEERVKLLKVGIDPKTIERVYLTLNEIKLLNHIKSKKNK